MPAPLPNNAVAMRNIALRTARNAYRRMNYISFSGTTGRRALIIARRRNLEDRYVARHEDTAQNRCEQDRAKSCDSQYLPPGHPLMQEHHYATDDRDYARPRDDD